MARMWINRWSVVMITVGLAALIGASSDWDDDMDSMAYLSDANESNCSKSGNQSVAPCDPKDFFPCSGTVTN